MKSTNCQECNHEILSQVKSCPHCGCLVKSKDKRLSSSIARILIKFIIAIVILTMGGLTTTSLASNINNQKGLHIEEKVLQGNGTLKTVEKAKDIIQARLRGLGISDAKVYTKDKNIIAIDVSGITDKEKVLSVIEMTGKLTFIGPDKKVILTGSNVKDASVKVDGSGQPIIQLKLNRDGANRFASATKKFLNQRIAIYIDQTMYSNPTVCSVIKGGEVQIYGMGNTDEAKRLTVIIKSGALPVSIKNVSVNVKE